MTGSIIDIRRFTLHDGQGIRSTLFLKGCALRCAWCHNPEGLESAITLWYLARQCIRCRACASVCPRGALSYDEEGEPFVRIDRTRCDLCGACVATCPTGALAFDGRIVTAQEAAQTLLRDIEFYRQSGGGITISGGDPLVQADFSLEVLALCKAQGVHTAIETCLFGTLETLERFIPWTDLFIVDLKLADSGLHTEYTRQPNGQILANYAALAARKLDMLTRIPLVPGITATPSNIGALAAFIAKVNPGAQVELVNFNPLASSKYALLNKSQEFFEGMEPIPAREVEAIQAILLSAGLQVLREHRRAGTPGR